MKLKLGRRRDITALPDDHMPANGLAAPVRVYTAQGRKAHLALALPVTSVLCGWPPAASGWLGTGSPQEREYAAAIETCRMCDAELRDARGEFR